MERIDWLQEAIESALCKYTRKQLKGYSDKDIRVLPGKCSQWSIGIEWWYFETPTTWPATETGHCFYSPQEALKIFLAS